MLNVAHRERTVEVGGHVLFVRETGEGHPLLLVNGIGAHLGMWGPLERALLDAHVIAYDSPGTGRSPTPLVPLSLDALARLAEELLDRLGHERVDVLGYSFGGLVAQRLARLAGPRVRRLVLAATTPGWGGVPGSLRTMTRMATPLRYYWRPYWESVAGDLMGGRARTDPTFVHQQALIRRHRPPDVLGYTWQLAALAADSGSLGWLHTLPQPTLVVAGDDDPIMPLPNAMLLAHGIPDARLCVAKGEGHLLMIDPKSPALAAVRGFVTADDLDAAPAWRAAVRVTRPMLDAALEREGVRLHNPLSIASAAVRTLWRS